MPTDADTLAEQLIRQLGPSNRAPLSSERGLALSLQVAKLAQQLGGPGRNQTLGGKDTRGMQSRIASLDRHMDKYEDDELLDQAMLLIPLQKIYDEANELLSSPSGAALTHTDALVKALATWFKASFFTWIDPIRHPLPPHDPLEMVGSSDPTASERASGAGRVELWRSARDGRVVRFPRFNDPKKLLETRTGRCGEWANAFCACLRALGIRARYVWNSEDHVWTEYFSHHEGNEQAGRWCAADPCEASVDQPLVYALGWGKAIRYCLAFSTSGVADVTARYVPSLAPLLKPESNGFWRDMISEADLTSAIRDATNRRRLHLSDEERATLAAEDERERAELSSGREAERLALAHAAGLGSQERTSGTLEWRKVRGEATGTVAQVMPSYGHPLFSLFSSGSVLTAAVQLNGSATSTSDSLVLTNSSASQTSSAFFPLPDSPASILQLEFRITPVGGGEGADGMALVFHSDPRGSRALGGGGSDLGYAGICGGWALEIDCYRSRDTCDDPPTPHISLHASKSLSDPLSAHHRSSIACTSPGSLPPLNDGRPYALRVAFDRRDRSVAVWLTDSLNGTKAEWEFLFRRTLPVGLFQGGKEIWAGFTASTGGLAERHEVLGCEIWKLGS